MLSVFMTPWQNPTACHLAISRAVRAVTSGRQGSMRLLARGAVGIEPADHMVGQHLAAASCLRK